MDELCRRLQNIRATIQAGAVEAEAATKRWRQLVKRNEKGLVTSRQYIRGRMELERVLDRVEQAKKEERRLLGEEREDDVKTDGKDRMAKNVQIRAPETPVIPVEAVNSAPPEPRKPPCPACGSRKSTVKGTNGETRYRSCVNCGRSFATFEAVKK